MVNGKGVVSMEEGKGENEKGMNKYACACAAVASLISIIFGYGTIFLLFFFSCISVHADSHVVFHAGFCVVVQTLVL